MNTFDRLQLMLTTVSTALGEDLLKEVAFVGGCVVGLLLTDDYTRQQVRATDDVDLIVDVMSYADYTRLESQLRRRGFSVSPEDDVTCRWRLGELIVDVMPTDEKILGFSNIWYETARQKAEWHTLTTGGNIRVVTAPYFLATKVEAFRGRGNGDFMASRDIEDIVNLINGRDTLAEEVKAEGPPLIDYIKQAIAEFLTNDDFEYVIESSTNGDRDRVDLVYERMNTIVSLSSQ